MAFVNTALTELCPLNCYCDVMHISHRHAEAPLELDAEVSTDACSWREKGSRQLRYLKIMLIFANDENHPVHHHIL